MNVKFKMPRFGKDMMKDNMLRELILSTLATSISIIFTFGTAAWLDHRQKVKNRRQTAMMVICDIHAFKSELQNYQDEYFIKWQKDLNELQSMSRDSIMQLSEEEIQKYGAAIILPVTFTHDKTAENIFSSDISTWRELGNFKFIRIVGNAFSYINDIEKNIKAKMDERGGLLMNFQTHYDTESIPEGQWMITFLEQKEVQRCITDFCNGFVPYIQGAIQGLDEILDDCLEITNFTKAELNEFMEEDSQ